MDVLRERLPPERDPLFAVDLRAGFFAAVEPAEPVLAAAERFDAVERDPLDLARDAVERVPVDLARELVDARPEELRDEPEELREELDEEPDESSSPPHLPLITRCAASATASAMMLPSLVALDIMLVAACEAVSAASRPASRILRRALGLALIAAAAAARPAASISLLIAALAILSIVSLRDVDPCEPEEPLFADFAIVNSPVFRRKRHSKDVTVP